MRRGTGGRRGSELAADARGAAGAADADAAAVDSEPSPHSDGGPNRNSSAIPGLVSRRKYSAGHGITTLDSVNERDIRDATFASHVAHATLRTIPSAE
eukprot:COSAG02_NODE_40918_length_400_cov_0.647841_1_plen_97_part_01